MKRSMKTKILACVFILDLVMVIGVSIIGFNFRTTVTSANLMSETYMMVERDVGYANTNVQNLVKRFFVVEYMAMAYGEGMPQDIVDSMNTAEARTAARSTAGDSVSAVRLPSSMRFLLQEGGMVTAASGVSSLPQ